MSPLTLIAQTLEELPGYLFNFVVSLLVAIMSDAVLTSLTLGAVALGLQTNLLIALAAFFFMYVFIRAINTIANAIGNTGQTLLRMAASPPPAPFTSAGPPEAETPST